MFWDSEYWADIDVSSAQAIANEPEANPIWSSYNDFRLSIVPGTGWPETGTYAIQNQTTYPGSNTGPGESGSIAMDVVPVDWEERSHDITAYNCYTKGDDTWETVCSHSSSVTGCTDCINADCFDTTPGEDCDSVNPLPSYFLGPEDLITCESTCNGVAIECSELCDGALLDGKTCEDFGLVSGLFRAPAVTGA